jgi:hypothetical protein
VAADDSLRTTAAGLFQRVTGSPVARRSPRTRSDLFRALPAAERPARRGWHGDGRASTTTSAGPSTSTRCCGHAWTVTRAIRPAPPCIASVCDAISVAVLGERGVPGAPRARRPFRSDRRGAAAPVEQADFCRAMAQPRFLAVGTVADGVVRVFTGLGGTATSSAASPDPHYDRIAYATHTAPDVNGSDGGSIDMRAALLSSRARRIPRLGRRERVEVTSIPWEGAEVRVHRVVAHAGKSRSSS